MSQGARTLLRGSKKRKQDHIFSSIVLRQCLMSYNDDSTLTESMQSKGKRRQSRSAEELQMYLHAQFSLIQFIFNQQISY